MKMSEPSLPTLFPETELALTLSPGASRAKTLALLESARDLKAKEAACGPKSSDLLASYHPATSSWRTSQTCLVALANGEGDGLAEFSETWPSAGMMRSGETFQLASWEPLTGENESGLWPTPRSCSAMAAENIANRRFDRFPNLESVVARRMWPTPRVADSKGQGMSRARKDKPDNLSAQLGGALNPTWVEWLMGFPLGWTDLKPSETP